MTRWAILGIGRVTPRMVHAIRGCHGHSIVQVAARDKSKLAQWQSEFGVSQGSTDFEATIACPDVDAVYIALPPALHARWGIAAMQHGKRVLCEKPLAMDVAETIAMNDASVRTGMPLVHATGFPFHPRSRAIREVVDQGALGEVKRVTVACSFAGILDRPGDHRIHSEAGGGCLLDLGWYCVYSTLWMTGLRPTWMQSIGTRAVPDDPASAWLHVQTMARLSNGAVATWDCGYDAAGRKWIEIAGTKGSVICDDFLRPWDLSKPRFWVHGHDGNAQSSIVGEGLLQESAMVEFAASCSLAESLEQRALALETQSILEQIEASATASMDLPRRMDI